MKKPGDYRSPGLGAIDHALLCGFDRGRWLTKARKIQWDYKNIVKRRGKLLRIEDRRAAAES